MGQDSMMNDLSSTPPADTDVLEIQDRKLQYMWLGLRKRLALRFKKRLSRLDVIDRIHLDAFPYPQYAYGIYFSCMQARMLGYSKTTVIEFGVAGGNGLVAMENAAHAIGQAIKIEVDVLGFDNGEGMPPSTDYRDMIYWFRPSAYKMDVPALKKRLKSARLVLGDIRDTVGSIASQINAPIGFCAMDMDYYSATASALDLFEAAPETRQPRVMIYADDIFGVHDLNLVCSELGEEKAFFEFNSVHPRKPILPVRGLRHKRPFPAQWNDMVFALHDFEHPHYNRPINPGNAKLASQWTALRN